MKNIAVFGSGTMGNGIAHVFALNGFQVQLFDKEETILARAIQTISSNLDRQIKKNIITVEQKESTLQNIKTETLISNINKNTDLVIEAIVENKLAKISLYNELLPLLNPNFILATNTSSISITELAPKSHSDKFIGMHFMNPVPLMELVEIIRGLQTSDETYSLTKKLAEQMGKVTVLSKDSAGFIVNRILVPMINEAIYTLYQGIGTPEDIDAAMKLGTHQPMGPLALADFVGLDTVLSILEVFHESFGDKFQPCPLLKQYVDAGWLGKKTGRGFYNYTSP